MQFSAEYLRQVIHVPALVFVSMAFVVWGLPKDTRAAKSQSSLTVAAIAITAPTVYIVGSKFRDRIVFAFWSQAHLALINRYTTQDSIISTWDSWGNAGMETIHTSLRIMATRSLRAV